MLQRTRFWIRRLVLLVVLLAFLLLALRVAVTERGPALEPWHTWLPAEMSDRQMDRSDWSAYLRNEQQIFARMKIDVRPSEDSADSYNRYAEKSPVYPARFATDWNRSYQLLPQGKPRGAVVLLHGLTDSPYSLRHFAADYQQHGYVVVAIRLPGHGTVPAALTQTEWEDWLAATRLAVREAHRRIPAGAPLQIMGFSNGGALAMKYTLDALEDPSLPVPNRLILISPMIGVSSYARYAGLAGLPSLLPAFARSAWLSILPEFNPFKYNSFPVKAARQSWLLTSALQSQLHRDRASRLLDKLPPVLTFQSVADATVSTPAVVRGLYNLLPANGSELVLFDVNRSVALSPLMRPTALHAADNLLPATPRNYAVTLVTNAAPTSNDAVARTTPAGSKVTTSVPLGVRYPADVYSLSHVALPFPFSDSLYGRQPDRPNEFGVSFGVLTPRGERSVLMVSLDMLMRQASNPFWFWMQQRVNQTL
ncbi:alpha-beta hydrolase superfamily lysophospholipase [Erwinia persicina]|jgi:alpha-beta hydrolase superfamily lysophospholipase|uniref:Alpha/beta hydrolase n=1 Tax=Erwinia aeris TaxID=3239803 RepID=A0ABV4E6Z7_9GAMM|nr:MULTISPECIES: alpha/beta hydrolase [Erwinia]MCP1438766.1 alpha-beta hydrolase superfamily lysophospholipase [Erwinia persicina]MDN4628754.1 alpha/beta hydrolase [Erwinia sp. PsM31]MDN8542875.1 alpha/beta hydrolase [Erwinia sp. BC051422]